MGKRVSYLLISVERKGEAHLRGAREEMPALTRQSPRKHQAVLMIVDIHSAVCNAVHFESDKVFRQLEPDKRSKGI